MTAGVRRLGEVRWVASFYCFLLSLSYTLARLLGRPHIAPGGRGSRALGEPGSVHSRDHPEMFYRGARNLSMSDIHHRPRKHDASETELDDVVSVLSKNLSPV